MSGADDVVVKDVVKDSDYFMEHPEEFDALTEEERTKLLIGVDVKGDTAKDITDEVEVVDDKADKAAAPDAAKTEEANNKTDGAGKDAEAEQVIQAKDGKHTIPYKELEDARLKATGLEQQVAAKDALIESLKAAQKVDEKAGNTDAQEELLAALNEEYPDLMVKLGPVMDKLIQSGVSKQLDTVKAELQKTTATSEKTPEELAFDKHFAAIAEAHSDYESVFESKEFESWRKSLPSYAQPGVESILDKGTTEQVISLLNDYKKGTTQEKKEELTAEQLAAKAKETANGTKQDTPSSLSAIPAGSKAHHDEGEALLEANGMSLVNSFLGKTPKQVEEMIAKVI